MNVCRPDHLDCQFRVHWAWGVGGYLWRHLRYRCDLALTSSEHQWQLSSQGIQKLGGITSSHAYPDNGEIFCVACPLGWVQTIPLQGDPWGGDCDAEGHHSGGTQQPHRPAGSNPPGGGTTCAGARKHIAQESPQNMKYDMGYDMI